MVIKKIILNLLKSGRCIRPNEMKQLALDLYEVLHDEDSYRRVADRMKEEGLIDSVRLSRNPIIRSYFLKK